jgi:hypothetical protein
MSIYKSDNSIVRSNRFESIVQLLMGVSNYSHLSHTEFLSYKFFSMLLAFGWCVIHIMQTISVCINEALICLLW